MSLSSFGDCEFDVNANSHSLGEMGGGARDILSRGTIGVLREVTKTSGIPEVQDTVADFLFLRQVVGNGNPLPRQAEGKDLIV
jgi:hypothetical protein